MATLIRVVNGFYAALFVIAALVSLGFLVAALDGLGRGPEAVWLSCAWAALFALFAALCFANMRRARGTQPVWLVAANLAALLLAGAGLFAADPVIVWMAGVSILPFAVTLLAHALAGRKSA